LLINFNPQQKTIEGKTGNVIISPVSIQSAVTLAMFGASGETRYEMLSGLKISSSYSNEAIAKNFESFTENVNKSNGLKIGEYFAWAFLDIDEF
jgi:serine protease inhibitor